MAALEKIEKIVTLPAAWNRQQHRQRIHELSPSGQVFRSGDHLHPVSSGELQRRYAYGAEELGGGPHDRGDHCHHTPAELLMLNKIGVLQSLMTSYFPPVSSRASIALVVSASVTMSGVPLVARRTVDQPQ